MVTGHAHVMATNIDNLAPANLMQEMRPERIGHRMKIIRMAHGMSPAEISDALGIERTYWSRCEGGKRGIPDALSALLVDRFGVTLDFLLLNRWDKLPFDTAEKMRAVERKLAQDPSAS